LVVATPRRGGGAPGLAMINELLLCEKACPVDGLELTCDFNIAHNSRQGMI
jgi:hypothetical protein